MPHYNPKVRGVDNSSIREFNNNGADSVVGYGGDAFAARAAVRSGKDYTSNDLWEYFGLDPALYSGYKRNIEQGLEMSGADLQAQMVARNEFDYESGVNYEYAKRLYDETQSYSAKVAQMEDAGLNIGLMYGGNMSNNGGATYDSGQASVVDGGAAVQAAAAANQTKAQFALGAFQQLSQLPAGIQALRSQDLRNDEQELNNEFLRATLNDRIDKIHQELIGTLTENSTKLVELGLKQNEKEVSDATKDFDIAIRQNESLQSAIKTESDKLHLDTDAIEKEYKQIQVDMLKVDQKYQEQLIQLSIQSQAMDMLLKDSQINLNKEQSKTVAKQRELLDAQIIKLGKESGLIQKESDYKDMEMFLSYVGRMDEFISTMLNPDTQRFSQSSSTEFREYWQNSVTEAFGSLRKVWGDSGFYMKANLPKGYQWRAIGPNSGWSWGFDPHPQSSPGGKNKSTSKK